MLDKRHRNKDWQLPTSAGGMIESWEAVKIAVLMDIRDELQQLNHTLGCYNFQSIPAVLRTIRKNTSGLRKEKAG